MAVDPRIFRYGTKFRIPGFLHDLVARDTGTDVKSRKAAKVHAKCLLRRGEISKEQYALYAAAPVIDIPVRTRAEFLYYTKKYPPFVTAQL